jgi:thymidine kinase
MFSGKTGELLRRLRRARIAGQSYILFTPETDDRDGIGTVSTHNDDVKMDAEVVSDENVEKIFRQGEDKSVVGVDEVNFFNEDIIQVLERLADRGCRVVVAGLCQTFRGDEFSPVHQIMSRSDDIEYLSAICSRCNRKATRNQRLIDGKPAPATAPTISVGGSERYEPRCRQCHVVPEE